ncbi:hypothetical protein DESC_910043 [Desulfosarcina cetonica]|nr:hypothetical protein DESC_910043 [Desulfosarcina cetonica]
MCRWRITACTGICWHPSPREAGYDRHPPARYRRPLRHHRPLRGPLNPTLVLGPGCKGPSALAGRVFAADRTRGEGAGGADRGALFRQATAGVDAVGGQMLQGRGQAPAVDPGGDAAFLQGGHDIIGGHIAAGPGGIGAAAQTAHTGIDGRDAGLPGGQRIHHPPAVGVVEMRRHPLGRDVWPELVEQPCNLFGRGLAYRIGNGHFVDTDRHQPIDHGNHSCRRDVSLEGAPEGGGHISPHRQAGSVGRGHHRAKACHGTFDAGVDVLAGKGFAGGGEHGDLVRPRCQGLIQPLAVGHQGRVNDPWTAGDSGEHRGGITQLGHPARRNKGADLDFGHPAVGQGVHKGDLGGGGYWCSFVLKPIAWADFDDAHVRFSLVWGRGPGSRVARKPELCCQDGPRALR